jgi:hypothetical protein
MGPKQFESDLDFPIAPPHTPCTLLPQEAVFNDHIGMAQRGFLVHGSAHVGEQVSPIHVPVHVCFCGFIAD